MSRLKKRFSMLSHVAPGLAIKSVMRDDRPDSADLLEKLDNPSVLLLKQSHLKPNTYTDGEDIFIVHDGNTGLREKADMAYATLVNIAEKAGLASPAQSQARRDIMRTYFSDDEGNPTRFTLADIESGEDLGPHADVLCQGVDALSNMNTPESNAVVGALQREHLVINIAPSPHRAGNGVSAMYLPERQFMRSTYDPLDHANVTTAALATRLLHEGTHFIQDQEGMLAAIAHDPENARELFHLNELQAHVVQYSAAMHLFIASGQYDEFVSGNITKEELAERWAMAEDVGTIICENHLMRSKTGGRLLDNILARKDAGIGGIGAEDAEALVKEALIHGRIDHVEPDGIVYEETDLTRMQQYAHSHVSVLNFKKSRHSDDPSVIDDAILKHFQGDLGLSPDGNIVDFAHEDTFFESEVTHRPLSVGVIEHMWNNLGYEGDHQLGAHSEAVVRQRQAQLTKGGRTKEMEGIDLS